jgi:hypothetical protein
MTQSSGGGRYWHPGGGKWFGDDWNPGGGHYDSGGHSPRLRVPNASTRPQPSRLASLLEKTLKGQSKPAWHPPLKKPPTATGATGATAADVIIEDNTYGTLNKEGYQEENTDLPNLVIEDEIPKPQPSYYDKLKGRPLIKGANPSPVAKPFDEKIGKNMVGTGVIRQVIANHVAKTTSDPKIKKRALVEKKDAEALIEDGLAVVKGSQPSMTVQEQANPYLMRLNKLERGFGERALATGAFIAEKVPYLGSAAGNTADILETTGDTLTETSKQQPELDQNAIDHAFASGLEKAKEKGVKGLINVPLKRVKERMQGKR